MKTTALCFFLLVLLHAVPCNAQEKEQRLEKPRLAAVPLLNYNKSFGGIFGAMAGIFFPLSKKDTISPPSTVAGGGIVTTNNSWFLACGARLYYAQDNFRTVVGGGMGNYNFQFFSQSSIAPGVYIDYSTTLKIFYGEQLVRVFSRLYTGIDYTYYTASTAFGQDGLTRDTAARPYVAMGLPLTFDSRNNVNNPASGWYANGRLNRFDEIFGSSSEYTKLDIDASRYFGKDERRTTACKASVSTGLGAVPFEAHTVVGGSVLRGYSEGRYRGEQVYALQAEYRWNFYKHWGMVAFGGAATPAGGNQEWDINKILPAAGAGLRYMVIPDIRLNIGFDVAAGKGDYGVYFRMGEAF